MMMHRMADFQEELGEMRAERGPRTNEGRRNQAAPRQKRVPPRQRWDDGEEDFDENDFDDVFRVHMSLYL